MTLDPAKRNHLSAGDQKFLEIIHTHGWHVTSVAPREGDVEEWWSYTTGMFYQFDHPELIVFGIDFADATGILNEVGEFIRRGRKIEVAQEYPNFIADRNCMFKPISGALRTEYLCWSDWFYERAAFPALQLFWPDLNGKYPWHDNCVQRVRELQTPQLDNS